jgi:predicted ArsR family transcriptional regulator
MFLMMSDVKGDRLGDTKRTIVDRLKRADATSSELAAALGVSEAAVRQHLDALAANGIVSSTTRPPRGRGRPALVWTLTDLARDLFPDRHDDLTVELLAAIRSALGDDGVDRVIDARTAAQRAAYTRAMPKRASLRERVDALAAQRTAEGYVAEVVDDEDALVLVEHHCPICTAATACQGLCTAELQVFQEVLGDKVRVERTQHLLSGDRRCAYRITPEG